MHAIGAGKTELGRKRENNEDCYLVDNDLELFNVSDGMGGHAAGEVASSMAVDAVARFLGERSGELKRARDQGADAAPVVATLSPGDHIGASTLLLPRPARATVRASEPSRTLSLAYERFHTLTRARPWLGVDLLARLGRRACAGATDAV